MPSLAALRFSSNMPEQYDLSLPLRTTIELQDRTSFTDTPFGKWFSISSLAELVLDLTAIAANQRPPFGSGFVGMALLLFFRGWLLSAAEAKFIVYLTRSDQTFEGLHTFSVRGQLRALSAGVTTAFTKVLAPEKIKVVELDNAVSITARLDWNISILATFRPIDQQPPQVSASEPALLEGTMLRVAPTLRGWSKAFIAAVVLYQLSLLGDMEDDQRAGWLSLSVVLGAWVFVLRWMAHRSARTLLPDGVWNRLSQAINHALNAPH